MDTSTASLRFLEEFLKIDKQFQDPNRTDPTPSEVFKPFTVKIYDSSGYKIRELELIDAHIKNYEEIFEAFQNHKGDKNMSMTTEIKVVSAIQRIDKKALNVYQWHYSDFALPEYQSAELNKVHKADKTIASLFLVNRSCLTTGATGEDGGAFEVVAGFSPTGTGRAYGILDNDGDLIPTAIIHEIMHALGLNHTFNTKAIHTFTAKKTKNYMDYNPSKEYTWKWQWSKLRTYSFLK